MTSHDPVKRLYETIGKAMEKLSMRAKLAAELEPYLHEAGFENIHCQTFKVPIDDWAVGQGQNYAGSRSVPKNGGPRYSTRVDT